MCDISVIICTHNPRIDYLQRVLDALRAQTLPKGQWELLLVDNASREPLADKWDLNWHLHARHVREEELGLTPARLRGMREAKGELLVFFDDDNVPDPNFLFEANTIKQGWPQLGVWGGSIVSEFQVDPLNYLIPYLRVLALREVSSARWSNVSTCDQAEPWGAGLCLQKCVASAYIDFSQKTKLRLFDRRGVSLISGGDTEICMVACGLGLGMGVFPDLKLVHLIPKERLEEDYLLKITAGIRTSHHLIAYKWRGIMPAPVFGLIPMLRHFWHLLGRSRIERRVYLADLKAAQAARRIIAESKS